MPVSFKRSHALLMALGLVAFTQSQAQARPFAACYAVQKDAIGCWLSEMLGGDYIMPPDAPAPTGDDAIRLESLAKRLNVAPVMEMRAAAPAKTATMEKSAARSLSATPAAPAPKMAPLKMEKGAAQVTARPAARVHMLTCETGMVLDMIEKSVSPQEIAERCYK